jgi:hypothetical protein
MQIFKQMSSANESSAQQFPHSDPDLRRYVSNLKEFISFFTPGKMKEEIWHLACVLYEKHDEANWQYSERFNVYGMYGLLSNLCNSMQQIVAYFDEAGKKD